jgi:uncharacterized membrane protein HdeD (DUF308 family)
MPSPDAADPGVPGPWPDGSDAAAFVVGITRVVVLGDVVVASVVSVLLTAWTLLTGGIVGVLRSLFRIDELWSGPLSAGLAVIAGLVLGRHPDLAQRVLFDAVGLALLVNGFIRVAAAVRPVRARSALAASGGLSAGLGLLVLDRWPAPTLWWLGSLLAMQTLVDGVSLVLAGRPRSTPGDPPAAS